MNIARLIAVAAVAALLAVPPATAATPKLVGTVGPGFTITLTKGGKRVTAVAPGKYVITVRDRASDHNFHLVGPGVNKASSVDAAGTQTWRVTLKRGVYRFVCDPHADDMKGSFRVR